MRCRRLGRTGLRVSEIGFGWWGIGGTAWVGAAGHLRATAWHVARLRHSGATLPHSQVR